MNDLRENVSHALSTYMDDNNITAAELARRCRLTPSGLHRILKKGRTPKVETLFLIAGGIGVDINRLLSDN